MILMRKVILFASFLFVTQAFAQHTLSLVSGEKLEGKVISYSNDKLIFATNNANKAFESKEIQSIQFNRAIATASLSSGGSKNLNDQPKVTSSSEYKNTDVDVKKDYVTFEDAVSTSTRGVSYIMKGRSLTKQPNEIINSNREYGKVVVEVTIDKYGNVIEATGGGPGTNTESKYLFTKAEAAVRSMKFDTGFDYPVKQTGYVIVEF
jgi:hypothetical protein